MNKLVEYLKNPVAMAMAVGKENAIRRGTVAAGMGVSIRAVRRLAEEARKAGEFICYSTDSDGGGLYLAETDEERLDLMHQIRSECVRRLAQYSALRRALRGRGQRKLFPDVDEVFQKRVSQ